MKLKVIESFRRCRVRGFRVSKLRPSLPPRQGLTPPLPPWRGLWPSRISTAWASALPSLPAADTRVTSWAERRSAGDTGEGDSEGEGNTWPGANLLCTLSLTQSITQSLLHTPLPHPYLLVHFYTPTHWPRSSHSFSTLPSSDKFLCHHLLPLNSCLTAPRNRRCMLSSTRSTIWQQSYCSHLHHRMTISPDEAISKLKPNIYCHYVSWPSC